MDHGPLCAPGRSYNNNPELPSPSTPKTYTKTPLGVMTPTLVPHNDVLRSVSVSANVTGNFRKWDHTNIEKCDTCFEVHQQKTHKKRDD